MLQLVSAGVIGVLCSLGGSAGEMENGIYAWKADGEGRRVRRSFPLSP